MTYTAGSSSNDKQYDSMQSSLAPAKPSTIEEALLSASHMSYDTAAIKHTPGGEGNNKHRELSQTEHADDRSSIMSGFHTTAPGHTKEGKSKKRARRKSSFLNQPAATVFSSIMNLCNTVIGAGILALPNAMANTGLVLGFIMLVLFGVLAQITLNLSMMSGHEVKMFHNNIRLSYMIMCEQTVPRLKFLVDFSVGITCFGVCCAYLVVIGDLLPLVAEQIIDRSPQHESTTTEDVLESRELWIVVYLIVFIIPTTRLRKMDALRFTSTAAVICFTYVTVIVILYAFVDELEPCAEDQAVKDPARYRDYCTHTELEAFPIHSGADLLKLFKAAPTIIFAYTCHQNSYSVINELRVASKRNLNKVIVGSINVCCFIYCIVAFCGYYSFGESAPSNLLVAYPKTIPIIVVRISLSFAIAFSYPVLAYPARNSFSSLIFGVSEAQQLDWIRYNLITWGIILVSFTISMITNDLGVVLGVVGSTGTTIIAFILPGLFYFYLPNNKYQSPYKRYLALVMIALGCILVPFSITMVFVDA